MVSSTTIALGKDVISTRKRLSPCRRKLESFVQWILSVDTGTCIVYQISCMVYTGALHAYFGALTFGQPAEIALAYNILQLAVIRYHGVRQY